MGNRPRKYAGVDGIHEKPAAYAHAPRAKNPGKRPRLRFCGVELPDEVAAFCRRRSLVRFLLIAEELVQQLYPGVQNLRVYLEVDPESGEKAVVINLSLSIEVDELVRRSDAFAASWVEQVPYPQNSKIIVTYGIM